MSETGRGSRGCLKVGWGGGLFRVACLWCSSIGVFHEGTETGVSGGKVGGGGGSSRSGATS